MNHVKFNVFRYLKDEVRNFSFGVSLDYFTYDVFTSHIVTHCFQAENGLDLRRFRMFYITLEGDHVEVNNEDKKDKFFNFLCFIHRSKDRGDECINLLIVPKDQNEGFGRGSLIGTMDFRNLNDLFRTKINCLESYSLEKSIGNCSANIFIRQPARSRVNDHGSPSEPGLLHVRRIDENDLSRLLANGSQVLVAVGENNFLSLSFSKEDGSVPYQSMCWRNRNENFVAPEYQCEEVKIPAIINNRANINIREDFKNVLRFCEFTLKKSNPWREWPENVQQQMPMHHFQQQMPTQLPNPYPSSTQYYGQAHLARAQMVQAQAQAHQRQILQHHYRLLGNQQNQQQVVETGKQTYKNEENNPAWFDRYMKNFKEEVITDIKREVMKDLEKFLRTDSDEKVQRENTKETINIVKDTNKTSRSNSTRGTNEDWEYVHLRSPEESNSNLGVGEQDPSNQSNISELNDAQSLRKDFAEVNEPPHACSSIQGECYDSDSSVSLIMDDSDCKDELLGESDFIEIPGCFVTQGKNTQEDCSRSVSIRIKHRPSKTLKSVTSETKSNSDSETVPPQTPYFSSWRKADSNANSEKRSQEDVAPAAGIYGKPKLMNASRASFSNEGKSSNLNAENQDRREAQPVNILPDKVFEMTNNVFQNVLNSVKKLPHSNEVTESVQKVFEESLSAASRLIPNPLIAENSNIFDTTTKPSNGPTNEASSNANEGVPNPRTSSNDASRINDLPNDLSDKMRTDLLLLNEMGFCNDGQNRFFLSQYPDDLDKVVESLVNFTVL